MQWFMPRTPAAAHYDGPEGAVALGMQHLGLDADRQVEEAGAADMRARRGCGSFRAHKDRAKSPGAQ